MEAGSAERTGADLGNPCLDSQQQLSSKRPRTAPLPDQAVSLQQQPPPPVTVKVEAPTVVRTQFYPAPAPRPLRPAHAQRRPAQAGSAVHAAKSSQADQPTLAAPCPGSSPAACNSSTHPKAPVSKVKYTSAPREHRAQHSSAAAPRPLAQAASHPSASTWHTVLRQREAYDFIDLSPEPLRSTLKVFAEEVAEDGRRRFIVSTPERMWEEYERLQPSERHHYEIIREGCPCHLYFDLEYMRLYNPGLDGDAMVQALVEVVAELLKECFGFVLKREWVLELDSSTDTKFSRHVVVKAKRAAFKDNMHVKAFVSRVVERIRDLGRTQARFAVFTVSKGTRRSPADPQEGCDTAQQEAVEGGLTTTADFFIDTSVYSRNRAFRLFLSSKFGKQAILHATDRFGFSSITGITEAITPAAPDTCGARQLKPVPTTAEKAAAAHNVPDGTAFSDAGMLLRPPPAAVLEAAAAPATMPPAGLSRPTPAAAGPCASVVKTFGKAQEDVFFASLICYIDPKWGGVASKGSIRILRLAEADAHNQGMTPAQGSEKGSSSSNQGLSMAMNYGGALVPTLEAFIQSICFQGGVLGRIRSWSFLAGTSSLLLNIKDNRWCGNIQAQHKSNGIYFLIDVQDGTWHQRCYDPCCRAYRSSAMPLPKDVWDFLQSEVVRGGQEQQPEQLPLQSGALVAPGGKGSAHGEADWAAVSWGSSCEEEELLCQALDDFDARRTC